MAPVAIKLFLTSSPITLSPYNLSLGHKRSTFRVSILWPLVLPRMAGRPPWRRDGLRLCPPADLMWRREAAEDWAPDFEDLWWRNLEVVAALPPPPQSGRCGGSGGKEDTWDWIKDREREAAPSPHTVSVASPSHLSPIFSQFRSHLVPPLVNVCNATPLHKIHLHLHCP
jgi:hypothetical protein